jgi:carbon storage regulator CsrA
MLVLRREKDESVEISGTGRIRVVVVSIRGKDIQLGFDCDPSITVLRSELLCPLHPSSFVLHPSLPPSLPAPDFSI